MSHLLCPSRTCRIICHYEPCVVSPAPFLISPNIKTMDKVSCVKRQRRVMILGEKIELLDRLAQGENAASVRSAITGSMIVG